MSENAAAPNTAVPLAGVPAKLAARRTILHAQGRTAKGGSQTGTGERPAGTHTAAATVNSRQAVAIEHLTYKPPHLLFSRTPVAERSSAEGRGAANGPCPGSR